MFVVDELKTTLSQEFSTTNRLERFQLEAIRPILLLFNDPSGTFTLTLKEGATTLEASSLSMSTILSDGNLTAGQYHKGALRFNFTTILNKGISYTLELSSSGYTFAETSYLGWVVEHTNPLNILDGVITYDTERPYSFETWGYKR